MDLYGYVHEYEKYMTFLAGSAQPVLCLHSWTDFAAFLPSTPQQSILRD